MPVSNERFLLYINNLECLSMSWKKLKYWICCRIYIFYTPTSVFSNLPINTIQFFSKLIFNILFITAIVWYWFLWAYVSQEIFYCKFFLGLFFWRKLMKFKALWLCYNYYLCSCLCSAIIFLAKNILVHTYINMEKLILILFLHLLFIFFIKKKNIFYH